MPPCAPHLSLSNDPSPDAQVRLLPEQGCLKHARPVGAQKLRKFLGHTQFKIRQPFSLLRDQEESKMDQNIGTNRRNCDTYGVPILFPFDPLLVARRGLEFDVFALENNVFSRQTKNRFMKMTVP